MVLCCPAYCEIKNRSQLELGHLIQLFQYEHKKYLASYLVGGDVSQRTLQVVLDTLLEPSLAGGVLPDITGCLVASPLIVPFKTLLQIFEV